MPKPNAAPPRASPAGALGRLTATALAYAVAAGIVAANLPTILTPLPLDRLLPPKPPVVARTPVRMEARP